MAPSSQLPPKANAKARAIEDATLAAQALVNATLGMMRELRKALGHNPDREAECEAEREAELDRLSERLETQQNRHRALIDLSASVQRYLEMLPPSALIEAAPRVRVRLKDGESLTRVVDRIRGEIADQTRERHRVLRAELPIADRKRAARAYVNELAAKSAPHITADHDRFEVNFPGTLLLPKQALLAWLNPELFRERLCAQIDAMPKPKFALSTDAKRERLREIKAIVTKLEREEEALIEKAADEGFDIARRPDASPAVILGIVLNKKARVAA